MQGSPLRLQRECKSARYAECMHSGIHNSSMLLNTFLLRDSGTVIGGRMQVRDCQLLGQRCPGGLEAAEGILRGWRKQEGCP